MAVAQKKRVRPKGKAAVLEASLARVAKLEQQMRRTIRARYDAAQTTGENRKHWANADGLSAAAANSPAVRQILRNRSRYECANNGYADGMAATLADDCVGTGPRLQMLTEHAQGNSEVERLFSEWSESVDLAGKLWAMRFAKVEDGEAFGLLTTTHTGHPVALDLQLLEAEQVASPFSVDPRSIDGIEFDSSGRPTFYSVLDRHPGDQGGSGFIYSKHAAQFVIHYFRVRRPGQRRGVPEMTSSLPLFSQLRRYTLAVLSAAEIAAEFALNLYSDAPAEETQKFKPEFPDAIELDKGMVTVLPDGWKVGQVKAEQPATTYPQFKREILTEAARPFRMPYNVAAGDSSDYNYASGRLDHKGYFKAIRVEQALLRRTVLDPIFAAWMREAVLQEDLLPRGIRQLGKRFPHMWFFDGDEHVDPLKEAAAQEKRLQNNTTTLADEYGRRGIDWEAALNQRKKERELERSLGIAPAPSAVMAPVTDDEDEDEDEDDET